MRILKNSQFDGKKILLIDKAPKVQNDRTWCYWEKENGFFDDIVYKRWDTISFYSEEYSSDMTIAPYQYKMIRGIDFYDHCFRIIAQYPNVELAYGNIDTFSRKGRQLSISLDGGNYVLDAGEVFNSVVQPDKDSTKSIELLQHFKGWVVETAKDFFNPAIATMMDFRVHQKEGTTFSYVLPFDARTALVEYTLFTKQLLPQQQYDEELKNYISKHLGIENFIVREAEFGVIPMSSRRFKYEENGIYHIGTAGGQTKASSGYTFQFIQKHSQQVVDYLGAGRQLSRIGATPKRFRFYDNVLLYILYYNKLPGDRIFTRLFKRNKPQQVLRFLDNETSLADELKIIATLPTMPFLSAAMRQL